MTRVQHVLLWSTAAVAAAGCGTNTQSSCVPSFKSICSWDSAAAVCVEVKSMCSMLTQSDCMAASASCYWMPTSNECASLAERQCTGACPENLCSLNQSTNMCMPHRCTALITKEACMTAGDRCSWMADRCFSSSWNRNGAHGSGVNNTNQAGMKSANGTICSVPKERCHELSYCWVDGGVCKPIDVPALCRIKNQPDCLLDEMCDWSPVQPSCTARCKFYLTKDNCDNVLHCTWDAASTSCNATAQLPCSERPMKACTTFGCAWSPSGACTSCDAVSSQAECSAMQQCLWNNTCRPFRGCEEAKQSSSVEMTCNKREDCMFKNDDCTFNYGCDNIGDQYQCVYQAGCSWVANLGRCTSIQFAECSTGNCPPSNCDWAIGKCLPVVGCSQRTNYTCTLDPDCEWRNKKCERKGKSCSKVDLASNICGGGMEPCQGISDTWAKPINLQEGFKDGQTLLEVVGAPVATYASGEIVCLPEQGCTPCRPGYVQNHAAKFACGSQGEVLVDKQLCVAPQDVCKTWGMCDKVTNPLPCSMRSLNQCTGQCRMDFGACVNATSQNCGMYTDGAACRNSPGCTWMYGMYCSPSPCSQASTHEQCKANVMSCDWDEAGKKCTDNICFAKPVAECTEPCVVRKTDASTYCGKSVKELACVMSERECQRTAHCEWNGAKASCNLRDAMSVCSSLGRMDCLTSDICDWNDERDVCHPVNCLFYPYENECSAVEGCKWNATHGMCARNPDIPCDKNSLKVCAYYGCGWKGKDCVSCEAQTESTCNATLPCIWSGGSCVSPSCHVMGESRCRASGTCFWDQKEGECKDPEDLPLCRTFTDRMSCGSLPKSCVWDSGRCKERELGKDGCEQLDRSTCAWSRRCSWRQYEGKCALRDFCEDLEQKECLPSKGCSWVANLEKCTPYEFECDALSPTDCAQQEGCGWMDNRCSPVIGCRGLPQDACNGPCAWESDKCVRKGNKCPTFDLSKDCGDSPCTGISDLYRKGPVDVQNPFVDGAYVLETDVGITTLSGTQDFLCILGVECPLCNAGYVQNQKVRFECDTDGGVVKAIGPLCVPSDSCREWSCTPGTPKCKEGEGCTTRGREGRCMNGKCIIEGGGRPCEKLGAMAPCRVGDLVGVCLNGTCARGKEPEDTDCSGPVNPCASGDAEAPTECVDLDRKRNQKYTCQCSENKVLVEGVCVARGDGCSERAVKACAARDKLCTVRDNKPVCYRPSCPRPACPTLPGPGCTYNNETGRNGCLLFPCEIVCRDQCTPKQQLECMIKKREEGLDGVMDCKVDPTTGKSSCAPMPCPLPSCAAPPPGCRYHAQDQKDPITGCPLLPCGILKCPDQCPMEDIRRCASAYDTRKTCVMDGQPPTATCVNVTCPEVICNPPPGCSFDKRSTLRKTDANGCPVEACGRLVCGGGCTKEQSRKCCDPRKKESECKDCAVKENGDAVCLPRVCHELVGKACVAAAGCNVTRAAVTSTGLCPKVACNSVCPAYDPCGNKKCEGDGVVCIVVTGRPRCVKPKQQCRENCPSGRCTADGDCVEEKPCQTMMCPPGTRCVEAEGEAACLDDAFAACGGCDGGEQCDRMVSVSSNGRTGRTYFACKAVEDRPPCSRDACGCNLAPCGEGEVCAGGSCKPRRRVDPCAELVCPLNEVCRNVKGGVPTCSPRTASPCVGRRCPGRQQCDQATGECIMPTCTDCSEGRCLSVQGLDVCVPRGTCGNRWTWKDDACRTDADCSSMGGGYICPAPGTTLPEACVSEHCTCDPLTGGPGECSPTCHRFFRRCVPEKWMCDMSGREGWSTEEADWCCAVRQLGCAAYDCSPRTGLGPEKWTTAQKQFCCEATQGFVGCEDQAFHCHTREVWSLEKATWCCEEKQIGCPAPLHDCRDGKVGEWEEEKTKYCCDTYSIGCPANEDPPYNCSTKERWSSEKAEYCCEEHGLRCLRGKPVYDCDTEDPSVVAQWEPGQKMRCCLDHGRGCNPRTSGSGPYNCDEGTFSEDPDDDKRAAWCCDNAGTGCRAHNWCVNASRTGEWTNVQRKRCCSTLGIGCRFRCSADARVQASMTAEQRADCCEHKGLSCSRDDTATKALMDKLALRKVKSHELGITILKTWQFIMEHPKEFVRLVLRTLAAKLIGKGLQKVAVDILGFRPVNSSFHVPTEGLLSQQQWDVPRSWGMDPVTDVHQGSVAEMGERLAAASASEAAGRGGVLLAEEEGGEGVMLSAFVSGEEADAARSALEESQDSVGRNNGETTDMRFVGDGVQTLDSFLPSPDEGPDGDRRDDDDDGAAWWVWLIVSLGGLLGIGAAAAAVFATRRGATFANPTISDFEMEAGGAYASHTTHEPGRGTSPNLGTI